MQLTMRVEHLVELLTLLTLPPLSTDCVFPLPRGKYNFLEYQPTVSEVVILRGCDLLLFLSHFLWFSMRHSIAVTKWWNVAKAKEKFETRKPANRVFSRKLQAFRITGNLQHWNKIYLTNRKQYTQMNGNIRNHAEVTYGVPRGSVFGPLVLLLFFYLRPSKSDSVRQHIPIRRWHDYVLHCKDTRPRSLPA